MTYKQAVHVLKIGPYSNYSEETIAALEIAIEAVKVQIPQKPLHIHKNYYCPVCKEKGWIMWDDAVPNDFDNYCRQCGQAIDWSEKNESL